MDDPRSVALNSIWDGVTGGKTLDAMRGLESLLLRIDSRGSITEGDITALSTWLATYRNVSSRPPLSPMRDWITKAMADGVIDDSERLDLLAWGRWMRDYRTSADRRQAEKTRQELAWRDHPPTDRQLAFLEELGATKSQVKNLTKGAASDLIERLLDERDGDDFDEEPPRKKASSKSGARSILIVIVIFIVVFYFMLR